MLHDRQITDIAERIAKGQLPGADLQRVVTERATDSDGKDAVRITLVLAPASVEALTGDAALDLLVELQSALEMEGEERLPIVEYATEAELQEAQSGSEPASDE